MKVAIVAFTDNGQKLLKKLIHIKTNNYSVYDKEQYNIKQWLKMQFYDCGAIIFIGAIGIATRLISGLIISKDKDPAVIVIDENAKFVIPILSGHIGGANAFANEIADFLHAIPVITTATDINNKFAVDVWATANGCVIDDISKIKIITSAILKNICVPITSDFKITRNLPTGLYNGDFGDIGICVSHDVNKKPFDTTLNIIPKTITLGVGCKKNTDVDCFEQFIIETLPVSVKAVKFISSIDLKKDEQCIIQFAKKYNIEFTVFSSEQLNMLKGDYCSSDFVKSITGVDNVCERSAVLQSNGELILPKKINNGMTLAVASSDWECVF